MGQYYNVVTMDEAGVIKAYDRHVASTLWLNLWNIAGGLTNLYLRLQRCFITILCELLG